MKKMLVLSLFLMNYAVVNNASWQRFKNFLTGSTEESQSQLQIHPDVLNQKISKFELELQKVVDFNAFLSERVELLKPQISALEAELQEVEPLLILSKHQENLIRAELLRMKELLRLSQASTV